MSSGAQKQTFAPPPPPHPPPRSGIGRNNMVTPLRPPPPPSRYYGEVTDRNQAGAQDKPEENSNAALSGTAIDAVITKGLLNPPNSEEQSRFSRLVIIFSPEMLLSCCISSLLLVCAYPCSLSLNLIQLFLLMKTCPGTVAKKKTCSTVVIQK